MRSSTGALLLDADTENMKMQATGTPRSLGQGDMPHRLTPLAAVGAWAVALGFAAAVVVARPVVPAQVEHPAKDAIVAATTAAESHSEQALIARAISAGTAAHSYSEDASIARAVSAAQAAKPARPSLNLLDQHVPTGFHIR